jgi:hypothetical protein
LIRQIEDFFALNISLPSPAPRVPFARSTFASSAVIKGAILRRLSIARAPNEIMHESSRASRVRHHCRISPTIVAPL